MKLLSRRRNAYSRGYVFLGSRPIGKFLAYLICVLMLTSSIQIPLALGAEYLTQETTPTPELNQKEVPSFSQEIFSKETSDTALLRGISPFSSTTVRIIDTNSGIRPVHPVEFSGSTITGWSYALNPPTETAVAFSWISSNPNVASIVGDPTNSIVDIDILTHGTSILTLDVTLSSGEVISTFTTISSIELLSPATPGIFTTSMQVFAAACPNTVVRYTVPVNMQQSIVAVSGDFFLMQFPDDFVFDDGYIMRTAFALRSNVRVPVTGVSLSETNLQLETSQTRQLQATITPSIATDQRVIWSSSNTDIATVSSTGLVTARRSGSATITVTTTCGNRRATANVVVNAPISAAPGAPAVRNINISIVLTGRRSDGRGQNDIRFRAVEGATRYRICRRVGNRSFTNRHTINRARTGNITFNDRANLGTRYTYRVRAYNSDGQLIGRGTRAVTTGRVRNLRAEAQTQTSIRLRWNRVRGAQGYRIYRADSGGSMRFIRTFRPSDLNRNTVSFTDRNLRSNRTYRYRVRAVRNNLPNSTFPRSLRVREGTMTLRQSTRAFMEGYRGVRVGPRSVDRMSMADRRVVIANRTVLTADQGRIRPPVKYHFNRVTNTLEIHLFVRYRRNTSPTVGEYLPRDFYSARRFRRGVNRFFNNQLMEVPGHYRYRTRVVWHDRPSRWVNDPNRPSRNQRYFTIYLGGVCGGIGPNVCGLGTAGSNWYHARMFGPLSGRTYTFMPTNAQVNANPRNLDIWMPMNQLTSRWFEDTAAHEMGHMLGLGDGYYSRAEAIGGVRMTKNNETSRLSGGIWRNMMYNPDRINRALPNDMEMILRAYSEDVQGRRHHQFYRTHRDPRDNQLNPISPEICDRRCRVRP